MPVTATFLTIIFLALSAYFAIQKAITYVLNLRKDLNTVLDSQLFPKCPKHNYEKVETIGGPAGKVTLIFKCTECGRIHQEATTIDCQHVWAPPVLVQGTEEGANTKTQQCTKCGELRRYERPCPHQWKQELLSGTAEGTHIKLVICTLCGASTKHEGKCTHGKTKTVEMTVPSLVEEAMRHVKERQGDFKYKDGAFKVTKKLLVICEHCGITIDEHELSNTED